ncbi:MAG: stealth family protein, partial [Albidovulum sp.]|uniref:stealth family protein n=1 Tax=Albidovulum sp. TaxID=1872424 RepID=UPI003C8ED60E
MDDLKPIDIVICWVDGNDPDHRAKRRQYEPSSSVNLMHEATDETRFANVGEIYYSIASILKFAPFIRKIWIVTDNQKPTLLDEFAKAGLCAENFIEIVDHRTIFRGYEEYLPTFNSLTIESMIWRIPGLSEQFVYFNDDVLLCREVLPSDWFHNGLPQIYATRQKRFRPTKLQRLKHRIFPSLMQHDYPPFYRMQENAAALISKAKTFWRGAHVPHALRRSTFERYFQDHDNVLRNIIRHRFRGRDQAWPMALAHHIEILRNGVAPYPSFGVIYINARKKGLSGLNRQNFKLGTHRSMTIQSLDGATDRVRTSVINQLTRKYRDF